MKNSILIPNNLILGIFLSSYVMAQHNDSIKLATPEQLAKYRTVYMTNELNLDSIQVSKVSLINLKYACEINRAFDGSYTDIGSIKHLVRVNESELKQVLSKAQFKLYIERKRKRQKLLKCCIKGNSKDIKHFKTYKA